MFLNSSEIGYVPHSRRNKDQDDSENDKINYLQSRAMELMHYQATTVERLKMDFFGGVRWYVWSDSEWTALVSPWILWNILGANLP